MKIPAASSGNDRNARIERLRASRAKDSEEKRGVHSTPWTPFCARDNGSPSPK